MRGPARSLIGCGGSHVTGVFSLRCACIVRTESEEVVEEARHGNLGSWASIRRISGFAPRPELAYRRDLVLSPAHLTARGL